MHEKNQLSYYHAWYIWLLNGEGKGIKGVLQRNAILHGGLKKNVKDTGSLTVINPKFWQVMCANLKTY